jgi:1-acyl-sn-glycerol-3-phosphate acyltransferase
VGLGQRVLVWPIVTLSPTRRATLLRWWLRLHARHLLLLARALLDVRVYVRGRIPAEPAIVLMNHQSILDICVGINQMVGPQLLIPTRDRYFRGLPGVSGALRLAQFPKVSQRRKGAKADLSAITEAAEKVARGDHSFFVFPEGHRTRDGEVQRFMTRGLKITLAAAKRPVYCIVGDGMWHARTFADATFHFAGTTARATVIGPFTPPDSEAELDSFIETLRQHMIEALRELRSLSDADVGAAFRILPD